MKFPTTALSALLASQAVIAAPAPAPGPLAEDIPAGALVEYRSANPQHMALAELDKRINCETLNRVVHSIGTSKFTVVFITSAVTLTRAICAYVNGENCGDLALIIQTGLVLVYAAAAHTSGATPETLPGARLRRDDDAMHAAYVDWWTNSLHAASNGTITYDSIETMPFDAETEKLQRRDGDPALLSRVYMAGVATGDAAVPKQDVIANHFADGNTLLHLPIMAAANGTDGSLGKRVPKGSGFKLSYTTRDRTLLTYSHQQEMAAFAAANWAAQSASSSMTDYIGFAETGHSANFYYRIIPESRSFGLNYESVDICGGMAGYL